MFLSAVRITNFKSIDNSEVVSIDPKVTILVGQNESGKTAFLQALHKSLSVEPGVSYDVTNDYPRKGLLDYEKIHRSDPAVVCTLTYELADVDITRINEDLQYGLLDKLSFVQAVKYDGTSTITLSVPEGVYVKHLANSTSLTSETKGQLSGVNSIRDLIEILKELDLNSEETAFLSELTSKFQQDTDWNSLLQFYVWKTHLKPIRPKFLYFDDYRLLPGKINLPELKDRLAHPDHLQDEDRTALSLFQIAGVDLEEITEANGYEKVKAKLEAISNSITDKVFDYWRQNQDLDVEFDIRPDPTDVAPFNQGNNLYVRIYNRRHRVSVPFSQRSKGFIWFFSFIIWFESIKRQIDTEGDLILLLDEPGLSLHALAQADFLEYIDHLANNHQILYTTHSPFMVPSDRLHQVRMVEDKDKDGTRVTSNVTSSDPKTIFPLQAALGYSIAQNLFISRKNLLVEGPADLIYLRFFSSIIELHNREHLNADITITPVGGLDKLATFIALLGGNELDFVVLHDFNRKPDVRLESLVRQKLITNKQVLHYGMFRNANLGKQNAQPQDSYLGTDVEDMLTPKLYLTLFNSAYKKELNGVTVKEEDLPHGDRVVERINSYLSSHDIKLRATGGFNHYLVANYLASNPPAKSKIDTKTLERFERLFIRVNSLL